MTPLINYVVGSCLICMTFQWTQGLNSLNPKVVIIQKPVNVCLYIQYFLELSIYKVFVGLSKNVTTKYHFCCKNCRKFNFSLQALQSAINKGESKNWKNQQFSVHPYYPNAKVLVVSYNFYIQPRVSQGDGRLKLPVIIGIVPFRSTYGQTQSEVFGPKPQGQLYLEVYLGPC